MQTKICGMELASKNIKEMNEYMSKMPVNEPKEILEILKALDKTTKEQLDKAIENADNEEG